MIKSASNLYKNFHGFPINELRRSSRHKEREIMLREQAIINNFISNRQFEIEKTYILYKQIKRRRDIIFKIISKYYSKSMCEFITKYISDIYLAIKLDYNIPSDIFPTLDLKYNP